METSAIDIPQVVTDKWQEITNLVAELVQVPAALVTRIEGPEISVFVASKSQGNPYQPRQRACLNTGPYCETVMRTRRFLLIPDARDDDQWRSNADRLCYEGRAHGTDQRTPLDQCPKTDMSRSVSLQPQRCPTGFSS
jgi:hypothetical protein